MATSSTSGVGSIRALETPTRHPGGAVSIEGGGSLGARALYDPMEFAFMEWIKEPNHNNIYRLSYEQYREYKYWNEHRDEPAKGAKASNYKSRSMNFHITDGMLYHNPYTVQLKDGSTKDFGPRRVI